MARRIASARPTLRSRAISATAVVTSFTVALELTAQCETKSARAGIDEGAGNAGERLGAGSAGGGGVARRQDYSHFRFFAYDDSARWHLPKSGLFRPASCVAGPVDAGFGGD